MQTPSPSSPRGLASPRLTLILWNVLPATLTVALALLALDWLHPAPRAASAPPTDTALVIVAASPTQTPVVAAMLPPTDTPTLVPSPSPTLDEQTAATLNDLPSSLGDVPATFPPPETPVPPTEPPAPPTITPPPPTQAATGDGAHDPITGLPADPAKLARVPLVVMVDNHPDAAPQTGLNSSSMVIEALAEGGITRFETIFLSGDAPTVGPIRSARPYFVEWAYPFRPLFVHCGGSWEAIDLIKEAAHITDVDCFNGNMPFWRSDDRVMPHNLYSSTTDLWKMAARRGIKAPATLPGFLHSDPAPAADRPARQSVGFTFSGLSRSDVTWVYDPDSNRYLRQQWGFWHRDMATGDIVSASNVVILWTDVWNLPGDTSGRLGTDTIGADTALILRDGRAEWGYWARPTVGTPLQLFDGKHQPMSLAPGRLWIEVLGIGKKVDLRP
jgi:hypothetical protein